jgi:hypothetical protein
VGDNTVLGFRIPELTHFDIEASHTWHPRFFGDELSAETAVHQNALFTASAWRSA